MGDWKISVVGPGAYFSADVSKEIALKSVQEIMGYLPVEPPAGESICVSVAVPEVAASEEIPAAAEGEPP